MSENRVGVEARGYLRTNKLNKFLLLILNLATWGSYLCGYTGDLETAGLFSISLVINVIFLKMAITHVKRDALATGYCSKGDSIFDILSKFSEDIKGSPKERVEYRKKHELLSARLDATATMIALLVFTLIFWLIFAIKVIF